MFFLLKVKARKNRPMLVHFAGQVLFTLFLAEWFAKEEEKSSRKKDDFHVGLFSFFGEKEEEKRREGRE